MGERKRLVIFADEMVHVNVVQKVFAPDATDSMVGSVETEQTSRHDHTDQDDYAEYDGYDLEEQDTTGVYLWIF